MSPKTPGKYLQPTPQNLQLHKSDLTVILRAADDLNGRGGIDLLVKILKGKQEPSIRKLGLENSPVFGIYEAIEQDQIMKRIEIAIQEGYLTVFHSSAGKSLLILSQSGKAIEKETMAIELLNEFDELLSQGEPYDLSELQTQDQAVKERLLNLIESSQNSKYIPLLVTWEALEHKKNRNRIDQVIQRLHLDLNIDK